MELTLGQSALQIWMLGRNDEKEAGLQNINEDWWVAWQVHLSPAYAPVYSQSYNVYTTVAGAP